MKIMFITGMVIAGFAGSMTASNVITQEQDGVTDNVTETATVTQTHEVTDETFPDAGATQSTSPWPTGVSVTQEVAGVPATLQAGVPAVVQDAFGTGVSPGRRNRPQDKTRQALNALKKAKTADDDDAQADAERNLRTALSDEYDAMLEIHEQQLDALEKKISELRKQLRRREDAKSELVDLKFKMMLHEADGLAWPGRSGAPGLGGGFGGPTIFDSGVGSFGFGPGAPKASSGGGSGAGVISSGPRGARSSSAGGGVSQSQSGGSARASDGGGGSGRRERADRRDRGEGSGGRRK